jgi:ATP-binding cassette subfamily F protein uup
VLIVSHDRDFLDRTVTMVIGLDGSGRADVVAGGYLDWEKKRSPAKAETRNTPKATVAPSPPPKVQTKLSFKEKFELDNLPGQIEALNTAIERDEGLLGDAGLYARDPKAFERLTVAVADARAKRDAAEERWLELAEKAETMGG